MVLQLCRTFTRSNFNRLSLSSRPFTSTGTLGAFKVPEELIPKNKLEPFIEEQKGKGAIYDKKPFRLHLQAGKKYAWCSCGKSKSQPICDGTHKIQELRITMRPVFFEVEETKDYWLCNCKQTSHRPFCDGTHLNEEIQNAVKQSKF